MNRQWYGLLPLLLFATANHGGATTLYQQWQQSRHQHFILPLHVDYLAAIEQFDRLFQSRELDDSQRRFWSRIGMLVQPWGDDYWLLTDDLARPSGHGFYLICKSCQGHLVLQAPHGDSDLNTAKIALELWALGGVAALAINTAPRRLADSRENSDLAQLEGTLFNAFSEAVIRQKQFSTVVQLHGFSQNRRRSKAAATADIILSNGSRLGSSKVQGLQACLAPQFGVVRSYPQQVRELGGTRNQQGILLRSQGFDGFVHLEMAYGLRQRLVASGRERERLHRCLSGVTK
ncbi:hypothetical protein MNBD_GAMMA18-614 [hydrothermal vent metagenome]|uniref:Uncharacterized protein n=1 Tax=hydrothermal vent metagenome TaxID=652676 RepID=A0A3B0ZE24_9ZZZZ